MLVICFDFPGHWGVVLIFIRLFFFFGFLHFLVPINKTSRVLKYFFSYVPFKLICRMIEIACQLKTCFYEHDTRDSKRPFRCFQKIIIRSVCCRGKSLSWRLGGLGRVFHGSDPCRLQSERMPPLHATQRCMAVECWHIKCTTHPSPGLAVLITTSTISQ